MSVECKCMGLHRPTPMEYEVHHIWPKGMGGPDTPGNRVVLCPTAHYNTHTILRLFVREGLMNQWDARISLNAKVNRYSFDLAEQGYKAWVAAGRPGLVHGGEVTMNK